MAFLKNFLSKEVIFLSIIFIFTFILHIPYFSEYTLTSADESAQIYIAERILDGDIPYKDAVYDKPPGTYYIFALAFSIFGKSITLIRILTAVTNAATAVVLYFIGKKLFSKKVGIFTSSIFGFEISNHGLQAHWGLTEPYMIFFSGTAVLIALYAFEKEKNYILIASGIFIGASFLMKQPGILDLLIITTLILLVNWGKSWKQIASKVVFVMIGVIVLISMVWAYFWYMAALPDMIRWTFSTYFEMAVNEPLQTSVITIPFIYLPPAFIKLLVLSIKIPVLFYPAIIGLVLFLLEICKDIYENHIHKIKKITTFRNIIQQKKNLLFIFIWSLIIFFFLIRSPTLWNHSMIQLMPPLSLFAGYSITRIIDYEQSIEKRNIIKKFILVIFTFLIIINLIFYFYGVYKVNRSEETNNTVKVGEYIKLNTQQADRIYVFGFYPQIYVNSDRGSSSKYFSFLGTMSKTDSEITKKVVNDISENRPKFIIMEGNMPNSLQVIIKTNYYLDKIFQMSRSEIYLYRYSKILAE